MLLQFYPTAKILKREFSDVLKETNSVYKQINGIMQHFIFNILLNFLLNE